jgi:hypothetical protein
LREELRAALHDHDALRVELEPELVALVVEVVRRHRGQEQDRLVLERALRLEVDGPERLAPVV